MARTQQSAAVLLAIMAAALVVSAQQPQPHSEAGLSEAEIKTLVQRAVAMERRAYDSLDMYERTERVIKHDGGEKPSDITSRLVPVGASEVRVELRRDGAPASPDEIARKWGFVLDVIYMRLNNPDSAVHREYQRDERRKSANAKMIDAILDAFIFHYAGRVMRDGRAVVILDYEPNPKFDSPLRFAAGYKKTWGKVWIDEAGGAVVRMEAELREDVPFGAGIVAKVYKGARVELEQAQPFPGADVWLPTIAIFDINFRKFTFGDSIHRRIYSSDYRRIGPPAESLPLLRKEHALSVETPAVVAKEY
jgi:hypothetical protein